MARCEEELAESPMNQTPVPSEAETPKPLPEAPSPATKLVAFDTRFSKWVHEHCLTDFTYSFLRFFEYSGDGLFWLPASALFWLSPSAGRPETRLFALNLFVGLLLDLAVVGTLKALVRRKRPRYNRGHLVIVAMDHWSFPSGHSTRAAMVLTLLWLYTPLWHAMIHRHWYPHLRSKYSRDVPWVGGWLLPPVERHLLPLGKGASALWMVATACSRVVLGRHYALDVVGGVVIGVLEALAAHFVMHVPMKTSEMQHACLHAWLGGYEEAFWRFVPGGGLVTSQDFRDMNRQIVEADLGPV